MRSWSALDPAWSHVREQLLPVRGHPVRVLRADGASPDARRPQLLVHGLGGSAADWVDVIEPLRRYGPVVAVDLPGFGLTPVGGLHGRIDTLGEDTVDLLLNDDDVVVRFRRGSIGEIIQDEADGPVDADRTDATSTTA